MAKFNLMYWTHFSSVYEVEAESVEQAIAQLKTKTLSGELGSAEDLECDEDGIEVVD